MPTASRGRLAEAYTHSLLLSMALGFLGLFEVGVRIRSVLYRLDEGGQELSAALTLTIR
jgi:hypothetical protein